ncbi:MAG TPA: shikimate kinase [Candidatus Kapabacteria bacterium]|nr:shikimate kinase [Candidatus Kapabacteria bacterium]
MDRFAVFGSPISHSKSPDIYNTLFQENNITAYYTRVLARDIQEISIMNSILKLDGFNLTSPLKGTFPNRGSINTVYNSDRGNSYYNTDNEHFIELINSLKINNSTVLIIGGGESAKNIISILRDKQILYDIILRNPEHKKTQLYYIQSLLNITDINKVINNYEIIINTIPHTKSYLEDGLKIENKLIIDLIYQIDVFGDKLLNCKYISGEMWLIAQAIKSFEYYYPKARSKEVNSIKSKKYNSIALLGFMGAGKTTLAKAIAKRLSFNYIDIDEQIVMRYGDISNIFQQKGEDQFRKMEQSVLEEIDFTNCNIIATGAGILSSSGQINILKKNTYRIWVVSYLENSFKRIQNTDRPLLKDYAKYIELYENRVDTYFSNSDLVVLNENFNETVDLLAKEIQNYVI